MGMSKQPLYDLLGIGIGPFNLGLAALLPRLSKIRAVFLEQKSSFNWHPGLLLEGTTLQVPFLADLVTMTDPTSPYSFLNYLYAKERLYPFYFLERFHIPRTEYNQYCQWVADQLPTCRFGRQVLTTEWCSTTEKPYFQVTAHCQETGETEIYRAKHLVLGVGSRPWVAEPFLPFLSDQVFHTGSFLQHQERCRQARSIAVVGSGQSAAEVFYQLLLEQEQYGYQLNWLTRSPGFFPMEYSKLGLEHFTPDYIRYFYHLPPEQRAARLKQQDLLYKGISSGTIAAIFDLLYERTCTGNELPVHLYSQMEVQSVQSVKSGQGTVYRLQGTHREQQQPFSLDSEVVICGTGYQHAVPECIQGLRSLIQWDEQQRYVVQEDYRLALTEETTAMIFVQNGELHTHGVGAPDLGLGAHRNAVIINTLAGYEVYPLPKRTAFQSFGTANLSHTQKGV